ncbi:MAG: hypothetical protein P8H41_05635, partial [Schleiferiaceae bacterium]|nr:hypothetical protein [Schleiferiaceae bacterium]
MKLIRYMYRIPLTIVLLLLIISAVIIGKLLGVSMGFRHRMINAWRSMVLFTLGIKVNVKGEMVRRAGIAMCNHRSYADAI